MRGPSVAALLTGDEPLSRCGDWRRVHGANVHGTGQRVGQRMRGRGGPTCGRCRNDGKHDAGRRVELQQFRRRRVRGVVVKVRFLSARKIPKIGAQGSRIRLALRVAEFRNGDCCQDSDDQHHDEQLNQREAGACARSNHEAKGRVHEPSLHQKQLTRGSVTSAQHRPPIGCGPQPAERLIALVDRYLKNLNSATLTPHQSPTGALRHTEGSQMGAPDRKVHPFAVSQLSPLPISTTNGTASATAEVIS